MNICDKKDREVGDGIMTFITSKDIGQKTGILLSPLSSHCLIPNEQPSSHQFYMLRRYSRWGSAQLHTPNMVYCSKLWVSLASFAWQRWSACRYILWVEGFFKCPSTAAFWPWGKSSLDWQPTMPRNNHGSAYLPSKLDLILRRLAWLGAPKETWCQVA